MPPDRLAPVTSKTFAPPISLLARPELGAVLRARAPAILLGMIGICVLLQFHLVFVQPVNWDEFRFLADVHSHARGALDQPVQTFHVQLFGWLVRLGGNEVDQIVAARLLLLMGEVATLALINAVARRFVAATPALFAVLAYVSFSFVMRHGWSFRFDPPAILLLMGAAALLLSPKLNPMRMIAAGLAIAVAVLVTVKAAFFIPILFAIGLWRLVTAEDRLFVLLRLVLAAAASIAGFALLYFLHLQSLVPVEPAAASAHVAQSYDKVIGQGLFLPRLSAFVNSVLANPLHWLFLVFGAVLAGRQALRGPYRGMALVLLSFAIPISSILFYRNAFPYFYAFMLAPAAVLIAIAAARTEQRFHLVYPAAVMLIGAVFHYQAGLSSITVNQRRVIEAVHRIFPQPEPYIDRSSMISSFPQTGLFLSTWGMENYHAAGVPVMYSMISERQPKFLIINSPVLADVFDDARLDRKDTLIHADKTVLRDNFVHHWGPLFVAGKSLSVDAKNLYFELLVSGPYSIESKLPVEIDGRTVAAGGVVTLSRGKHVVRSQVPQDVILRWGQRLYRPEEEAPRGALFGGF